MKPAVLVLLVLLTACTSFSSMTVIGNELEDYDGDNILNIADVCPNSFYGEAVNNQGCTARQLRLTALKILPYQFNRIVRRIDRTTLRRAEQFISESLTHEYYQPNRSFLSCSGDNVFAADLNTMGALPILACKYVEEPRKVEVPVQAGRATFITSSGFGVIIRVEPQQSGRIQIRELGYVACNEQIRPLAEEALNLILESEKLILETVQPQACDPERVQKNIKLAEITLAKGDYYGTVQNYHNAWRAATSCNCIGQTSRIAIPPRGRFVRWTAQY